MEASSAAAPTCGTVCLCLLPPPLLEQGHGPVVPGGSELGIQLQGLRVRGYRAIPVPWLECCIAVVFGCLCGGELPHWLLLLLLHLPHALHQVLTAQLLWEGLAGRRRSSCREREQDWRETEQRKGPVGVMGKERQPVWLNPTPP